MTSHYDDSLFHEQFNGSSGTIYGFNNTVLQERYFLSGCFSQQDKYNFTERAYILSAFSSNKVAAPCIVQMNIYRIQQPAACNHTSHGEIIFVLNAPAQPIPIDIYGIISHPFYLWELTPQMSMGINCTDTARQKTFHQLM